MILHVIDIVGTIKCFCTTAVNVEFTQSEFIVFENESEMIITLEVDHPALTEFTVIVVTSPDTADGKNILFFVSNHITIAVSGV